MTIWCQLCYSDIEQVRGDPSKVCPTCHRQTRWTTQPLMLTPELWTRDDYRLLRAIRIAAD